MEKSETEKKPCEGSKPKTLQYSQDTNYSITTSDPTKD